MSEARAQPIFVVGSPRSGTTLLRAILNRHSEIGLCDETFFFYYVARRRRAFGDLASARNRRRLVDAYLSTRRMREMGLDLGALAERLMREGTTYPDFFASILRFHAEAHGKSRWGEKTPLHADELPALGAWYPDGRVVHIVRDPRDVVSSLQRMPWGARSVLRNARVWKRLTAPAGAARAGIARMVVRYEDLVADPPATMRSVCAFLGVAYEEQMLVPSAGPPARRPWLQRAQEAITTVTVGAWRSALSNEQVRLIEWVCAPEMAHHGYEMSQPPATNGLKLRGTARAIQDAAWERVRRAPRVWLHWARPRALAAEERWLDR
jgi:LPS sulfotransferase NodH